MTQAVAASPTSLDLLCINTVRTLAMDAVQKAESGHPDADGAGAAGVRALARAHMRHNPANPTGRIAIASCCRRARVDAAVRCLYLTATISRSRT